MTDSVRQYPEKILFVNGLTNEVTREMFFAEVPESIRLVPNAQGVLEPVVKIVEITVGNQRTIKQFGYNDVLLRSTVQFFQG